MHYNEDRQFEPDADRMQHVRDLTEGWNGVDLYGALNVIGATLALTEHPPFEPCEEELTDERSVGVTGIAHRLTCPHCGDMISEVEEVDWDQSVHRATVDPIDGSISIAQDRGGDGEGLGFRCSTCKGFAELPLDAEVEWYG